MLIAILIILILIIVTMFYSIFRIQKNYKHDINMNPFYRELLYIKALLVFAAIVLVFFGWNIQDNVIKDLRENLNSDVKAIKDTTKIDIENFKDSLKTRLRNDIYQDFSTALEGFIVEVPIDTIKTEITFNFKELTDIQGRSLNDFEEVPLVSLNYLGQPYTITKVTIEGFTVKRLAIFEGYTIGEMGPPLYNENKLIIWIINRD